MIMMKVAIFFFLLLTLWPMTFYPIILHSKPFCHQITVSMEIGSTSTNHPSTASEHGTSTSPNGDTEDPFPVVLVGMVYFLTFQSYTILQYNSVP